MGWLDGIESFYEVSAHEFVVKSKLPLGNNFSLITSLLGRGLERVDE